MRERLIRDYENRDLPLERRLPSLARRFRCLKDAAGLEPWTPDWLYAWTKEQGKDTSAWHAGHFVLNLSGEGPWEKFDAVAAVRVWSEEEKKIFATWALSWQ